LVAVGKLTIVAAMIIAVVVAPFLGIDKKGGFQYIQEYTGFVSPGVFAMFILGFFWKKLRPMRLYLQQSEVLFFRLFSNLCQFLWTCLS